MELVWETRASRGIMIERGDRTIKQGGPILREHSTSTLSILLIKKKKNNYHNRICENEIFL